MKITFGKERVVLINQAYLDRQRQKRRTLLLFVVGGLALLAFYHLGG